MIRNFCQKNYFVDFSSKTSKIVKINNFKCLRQNGFPKCIYFHDISSFLRFFGDISPKWRYNFIFLERYISHLRYISKFGGKIYLFTQKIYLHYEIYLRNVFKNISLWPKRYIFFTDFSDFGDIFSIFEIYLTKDISSMTFFS